MASQKFDVLDGINITGEIVTSANLTVDTDTLFVDAVTNRVGVRTNNPGADLEVVGTVKADNLTLDTLANQGTEATALMINASGVVGTRELGARAFDSTTYDNYNSWLLRDDDGTEVSMTSGKYLRVREGSLIDVNFTDTSTGSSADEYDLTVSHKAVSVTQTTAAQSNPSYGTVVNVVTAVTATAEGHVNTVTTTPVRIPLSDNTDTLQDVTFTNTGTYYPSMVAAGSGAQTAVANTNLNYNIATSTLGVPTISATTVTASGNMNVGNQIVHVGDTNTYMQFHAADQWRVVVGGVEQLEVSTSGVLANTVTTNQAFQEKVHDGGSGTAYTMDLNNGPVHKYAPTGSCSIDFSNFNPGSTLSRTFTLVIDNGGVARSITWPDSVEADAVYWADGIEPPPGTGRDIYTFMVIDGIIYGSLSHRNAGFAQ